MKTSSRVIRLDGATAEPWKMPALYRDPAAESAAEESIEHARENGYKAGFEAGMRDAQTAIEAQVQEQSVHLQTLISALAKPLANLDEALHQEMCELSMAISRQIIRRELSIVPEQVLAVVRDAFAVLPSTQRRIVLSLHPEDALLVRERMFDEALMNSLQINDDPSMTRGGCSVSTDVSHVDARVETRIAQIAAQILGDQRRPDLQEQAQGQIQVSAEIEGGVGGTSDD